MSAIHDHMEALRTKIVIATYIIMLVSVILPLGAFFDGYPSQFVLGTYVGSTVTLCGLNFYLYHCAPAASPAAAARVEQKG